MQQSEASIYLACIAILCSWIALYRCHEISAKMVNIEYRLCMAQNSPEWAGKIDLGVVCDAISHK